MRIATALALAIALVLTACGGGEENTGATEFVPAAGADTPPDAPSGSTYDVTGNQWLKLADGKRLIAARDYVADHPGECTNADNRSAAADSVRNWADASIGIDFPLNVPVTELLAEGCAAALQSGGQDLAP